MRLFFLILLLVNAGAFGYIRASKGRIAPRPDCTVADRPGQNQIIVEVRHAVVRDQGQWRATRPSPRSYAWNGAASVRTKARAAAALAKIGAGRQSVPARDGRQLLGVHTAAQDEGGGGQESRRSKSARHLRLLRGAGQRSVEASRFRWAYSRARRPPSITWRSSSKGALRGGSAWARRQGQPVRDPRSGRCGGIENRRTQG